VGFIPHNVITNLYVIPWPVLLDHYNGFKLGTIMNLEKKIENAITARNKCWNGNAYVPSWVDLNNVDLDQFFTKSTVAEYCIESLTKHLNTEDINICNYKFIEPSAGDGNFYNLLPENSRIGIDIMPMNSEIEQQDFLTWNIKPNGKRYITVGNPPFGYRAWLALAFINHAAKFSDYVAMILPMSFQSDGKGSPKHRVVGLELIHSEILPMNSFIDPSGKELKINALWQIWKKGENKRTIEKDCSDWIDLFTVDERKERLCGQNRLNEASYFLQRTYYKEPPSLVKSFSEVKYVCGYGVVIKKDKEKITSALNNVDWNKYSNLAAHNCRHISMYHIKRALTDIGFIND